MQSGVGERPHLISWVELKGSPPFKSIMMEVPAVWVHQAWPLGKIVCWHALLVVTKCLTTNQRSDDDCSCLPKCLEGLLECFAHYFPDWFGWAKSTSSKSYVDMAEYFRMPSKQRRAWEAAAGPVAHDRLFAQWARDILLVRAAELPAGMPGEDQNQWFADMVAPAYDERRLDKVSWAHPVWTILHLFPLIGRMSTAKTVAAEYEFCQAFLVTWAKLIPCPLCRHHKWEYCSHTSQLSLPPSALGAGSGLDKAGLRRYIFRWTVDLHNSVNARASPPAAVLTTDQALHFWTAVAHKWAQPYVA
jgi:hypothetical protein